MLEKVRSKVIACKHARFVSTRDERASQDDMVMPIHAGYCKVFIELVAFEAWQSGYQIQAPLPQVAQHIMAFCGAIMDG